MRRILIVEDEKNIAEIERDYLELDGFEVIIENNGSAGLQRSLKEEFDLVILSYTAARLSGAVLRGTTFDFLVLDEAQHIKNPGSGNTRNCKGLRSNHRIMLTGTPLENSPEDLWSVMDFLHPGIFGTLAEFRRTYAGIADDPELQHDLAMRSAPFIKRRTKREVAADLPHDGDVGDDGRNALEKALHQRQPKAFVKRGHGSGEGMVVEP